MDHIKNNLILKTLAYVSLGCGITYVMVRHRHKFMSLFTCPFKVNKDPYVCRSIVVIETEEECRKVSEVLRKRCKKLSALGFDCEWVTEKGKRRPVALVQLASQDGLCVLFRISHLKHVPECLKDILEDHTVLKVGVGPLGDAKYLFRDYGVQMHGCLDLRHLSKEKEIYVEGLSALSGVVLGKKLDKNWRIVCSDWEADFLSERQQEYAARDALAGILIFLALIKRGQTFWESLFKHSVVNSTAVSKYVQIPFKDKQGLSSVTKLSTNSGYRTFRRILTRKKLPYDNCFLQAPDGEVLATITRTKCDWYLSKGLATEILSDPLTIQLNFEPADRNVKGSWHYYREKKDNVCVVCGTKESLLMKYIVPVEYRKHFPDILKTRRSHDILALCVYCHIKSNNYDLGLRRYFANLCNADLDSSKVVEDKTSRDVRSFARALLKEETCNKIPLDRRKVMEDKIHEFCGNSVEITSDVLKDLSGLNIYHRNDNYVCHGKKVVEYFSNSGRLLEFERMWREHFLKVMKPQFLPPLWCVDHGHAELAEKL